jgi:hypothetical protein
MQGLQNYKMISDNMILNSVDFQPLFGAKASFKHLRATIKVIQCSHTAQPVSATIKNLVAASMDAYFSIWPNGTLEIHFISLNWPPTYMHNIGRRCKQRGSGAVGYSKNSFGDLVRNYGRHPIKFLSTQPRSMTSK